MRRNTFDASAKLMRELVSEYPQPFYNIMRLNLYRFNELLDLV